MVTNLWLNTKGTKGEPTMHKQPINRIRRFACGNTTFINMSNDVEIAPESVGITTPRHTASATVHITVIAHTNAMLLPDSTFTTESLMTDHFIGDLICSAMPDTVSDMLPDYGLCLSDQRQPDQLTTLSGSYSGYVYSGYVGTFGMQRYSKLTNKQMRLQREYGNEWLGNGNGSSEATIGTRLTQYKSHVSAHRERGKQDGS